MGHSDDQPQQPDDYISHDSTHEQRDGQGLDGDVRDDGEVDSEIAREVTSVSSVTLGTVREPEILEDGRFRNGRLAGLTMNQAIFVLAWPVITESFLNSFVGLVDTALSSGLTDGEAATDAIGGASYMMWLIGLVIMALGVGATALISRSIGKGRMGVASTVLSQTMLLSLILGVVVGVVMWFVLPMLATTMSLSEKATGYFITYMRYIAVGIPGASVLFGMIACSRGAGDSISPLKVMIVRNIVNLVFSWLLSGAALYGYTSPLPFELGIAGIALGTVVGDVVGAVMITTSAMSGKWSIRLRLKRMRPHMITVWRLYRLGVPNFFETFGLWFGNYFIVLFVGFLSVQTQMDGLLGVHIIAIKVEAFSFMPGFGMGIASATLAGQYLGLKQPELAKKAVFRCAMIASLMMALMGVAFIVIPHQITRLLSNQELHREMVPPLLVICGVVQIPFALSIVFRAAIRGAGDVKAAMAITWTSTYAIRLPIVYLLSGVDIPLPEMMGGGVIVNPRLSESFFGIEPGLSALWYGLCGEMAIRGLLFSVRFFNGGWLKARV